MRNLLFIALIGLCFAFPGEVNATSLNSTSQTAFCQSPEGPSAELVERIFRYMQQELGFDYECLCSQYDKGEITIEKDASGYLVRDSGGALIATLEDTI